MIHGTSIGLHPKRTAPPATTNDAAIGAAMTAPIRTLDLNATLTNGLFGARLYLQPRKLYLL